MENPQQGQAVSGIDVVSGWTFNDDNERPKIFLRIDGVTQLDPEVDIPCCSVRADVKTVFPNAPLETGFGFLLNLANLSAGPHLVGKIFFEPTAPLPLRNTAHRLPLNTSC